MPTFECHGQKQQDAIFSEAKITLLCTGIQFGKTTAGSIWMKRLLHSHTKKDDNFIITSPNYKILQQSTLPSFLKYMDGWGEYSKGDSIFKMHEGGTVYMRTATEPDSIVGITNVRGIWGDEAGKYSLYFWENMQARASFRDCPIMLTTSPYSTNWVFKELIKGVKSGKRTDINLIQASSDENPYFPKEEFKRRKNTMDPLRFAALYLGEFSRMHGLVYDCFDEDVHTINPCQLPSGTKYYAGIDWGFTDPFVLQVIAITPNGNILHVSEFYKTRTTINDQILLAKQKKQTYDITTFFCGPDQPGSIEEFNRNGLPAVGANNDIRRGIDCVYEQLKSGRLKLFKGQCPQTIDELENYHYPEPEDLDPDEDSKDHLPVGQNDHCIEENVLITTSKGLVKIKDIVAGDMVLTRDGFKRVLKVFDNGAKDVIKIGPLLCTKDHLIFSCSDRFVKAEDFSNEEALLIQRSKSLTEEHTLDIRNLSTTTFGNISAALVAMVNHLRSICIEQFGSITLVKYQKDVISITRTATISTILFKIWSVLPHLNTYLNTVKSGLETIKNSWLKTLTTLGTYQKNGIGLKKAESGTETMPKSPRKHMSGAVTYVEKHININLRPLGFAAEPVKLETLGDCGKARVYDLHVEGSHEYFANGILVHNCLDALRYVVISTARSHIKHTPKQINEVNNPRQEQDHEKRLKLLKKANRGFRGSENFS